MKAIASGTGEGCFANIKINIDDDIITQQDQRKNCSVLVKAVCRGHAHFRHCCCVFSKPCSSFVNFRNGVQVQPVYLTSINDNATGSALRGYSSVSRHSLQPQIFFAAARSCEGPCVLLIEFLPCQIVHASLRED